MNKKNFEYIMIKSDFSEYALSTKLNPVYEHCFIFNLHDPGLWLYDYLSFNDLFDPDYSDFVLKSAREHITNVINDQTSAGNAGTQSNAC